MGDKIKKNRQIKSKNTIKKLFISLAFILLFIFGFTTFYIYNTLNKVETDEISQLNDAIGIREDTLDKFEGKDNIINIALFGVDNRSEQEKGRSDSIIILTLDKEHKKLKMSSIMRDSYVNIEGRGKDKINHAYAFGGPQLAVKTINQNFELNIRDYVTVDFGNMEDIIDSLGGITLNIRQDELQYINNYINELAALKKVSPTSITKPGTQKVNGIQAVAYSRIRYTSGGDSERTERQRIVLEALLTKIKSAGVTKFPSTVNKLLPYVKTSLSSTEILKLGTDVLTSGIGNIEQERFPIDGYAKGINLNKIYYLQFDEEATKDHIYKYIFEDIKPKKK
ncbi:LCP family protein [Clostridium polynesiense]|uniref:LCP family protein n=1 Tax=Clostridium polynesiense TaxID=1325933 RepID=UPI000693C09A|nr:LCP family protein [Clostridium polynesiense]